MVLTCPKCGWDAREEGANDFCFRLCERVTTERCVDGLTVDGVLELDPHSFIELTLGRPWLRCGDCLNEFPVPEGLRVSR